MVEISEEAFLKELEEEIQKFEDNPEVVKLYDKKYKVLKGRENLLIILLQKSLSSFLSKVMADMQLVTQENIKIFKKLSDETIKEAKKITSDAVKQIADVVKNVDSKLDSVEGSWRQIAESLGKLSEYGLILGDFQAKTNIIMEKLEKGLKSK